MRVRRYLARLTLLAFLAVSLSVSAEGQTMTGCAGLRQACQVAGFAAPPKSTKGDRTRADCMDPLLNGTAPRGSPAIPLPQVEASVIAACQAQRSTPAQGRAGKPAKPRQADRIVAGTTLTQGPLAPLPLEAGATRGPNIVLILADDFSSDLISEQNGVLRQAMPNLAQMMQQGVSFSHYFVSNSLCCPSRASLFTGLLPHNSGVLTNTGVDGGYGAFMTRGDDARTFATGLHGASYATAMMGKYLNGYRIGFDVPQGWSCWAVADNGYGNYDYALNLDGTAATPAEHMTDALSKLGQDFITEQKGRPFFLELATFSPHAPYTPPARYAKAFTDLTYPRSPAYGARPDSNAPQWLAVRPPLDAKAGRRFDAIYRKRVQSAKGIDDMIGAIRKVLAQQGLADNTYVIFTSDNGYHMGEYSLTTGKMTPFDTDIRVPFVVVGPGVPAGRVAGDMAMNIDLYPTFLDLAGLPPAQNVDGQSLAGVMRGRAGLARQVAVVEHRQTEPSADDPDNPVTPNPNTSNQAFPNLGPADPPSYVALRMRDALYVEYLGGSGEVGYYDLTTDPYALHNIAPTLPATRAKALHAAMLANQGCSGPSSCSAAQALRP